MANKKQDENEREREKIILSYQQSCSFHLQLCLLWNSCCSTQWETDVGRPMKLYWGIKIGPKRRTAQFQRWRAYPGSVGEVYPKAWTQTDLGSVPSNPSYPFMNIKQETTLNTMSWYQKWTRLSQTIQKNFNGQYLAYIIATCQCQKYR